MNSLTSFYSTPSFLRSTPIAVLVIAVLYFLLGKASFIIPLDSIFVSPIFLPAGLALASVLVLGKKSLPGIWIGAFILNTLHGLFFGNLNGYNLLIHIIIGSGIACGSILASICTSFIITRAIKGLHPLYSGETVLILLVVGSISYATITASIGMITLVLGNVAAPTEAWYNFKTWWLGDVIGIILVVPFILSWFMKDTSSKKKFKASEVLLFGLITILTCYIVFFQYSDLKYIILPLLFWSVYRFGTKTTSLVIIIISLFAIITTVKGIGPFVKSSINNSILFLDLFLCVISICSHFMLTILVERQRADDTTIVSKNKLQKSETILEAIIESPKDVSIYSIGLNYEYLNFNSLHSSNMKEMNNIDIQLGMTLQECLNNKAELQEAVAVLDKVFLGESISTIKRFDANESYWELRTSPITNENQEIIGATVISTNITEKLEIEKALKKSEKKYREIFTNIHDVIFQIDLNGQFLNVSPSVQEFAEYSPEELIGKSTQFLDPDDDDSDLVHYLLTEKKDLINHEKIIKTKSGLLKPISLNAKLIYDKRGNPNHIDAIAQDITERKASEEKIALQNQKLQIQNKELEQFAYITSHDLQEPLITLKYFSELLLKSNFLKDSDEHIKQYLNFILESSDRMQKLAKGLLDYSRIGNSIDITEQDCNEIANNAIYSLSDIIKKTGANITLNKLPIVNGYSVELIQLFQYIISNAIEFRKKDIPLKINISAKEAGTNWQFSIEDNGIGIEKQNIEKLFIIFKRLNNREEHSGIGISLAMCKKITALHGGSIWAESTFGEGTNIHFTIPKIKIDKTNDLMKNQ